jgi:hypothetical protein
MNPDSETPCWMNFCLGLEDAQTDVEAAGLHFEIPDKP